MLVSEVNWDYPIGISIVGLTRRSLVSHFLHWIGIHTAWWPFCTGLSYIHKRCPLLSGGMAYMDDMDLDVRRLRRTVNNGSFKLKYGVFVQYIPIMHFNHLFCIIFRILRSDKVMERARREMYYEKPYQTRNRLSYEKSKRIYDTDMKKKVEFLMRKNRVDPWIR